MLARSWRTLEALCGCGAEKHELTLVFLPHTDSVEDDFELSTVCHRPESMDKLQEQTKFTKKELQVLYRGFKNVGLAKVIRVKKKSGSGCIIMGVKSRISLARAQVDM